MPAAADQLATWLATKKKSLETDEAELEDNIATAERMLMRPQPLKNQLKKVRKRLEYYEKLRQAVEAGYLIIPSFPVEAFAVRVQGSAPKHRIESSWPGSVTQPSSPPLPAGKGRYVRGRTEAIDTSYGTKTPDGKEITVQRHETGPYIDDLEFPVAVVKPSVLEATERAMALEVFDRLGVVQQATQPDPIIVGQIKDPRSTTYNERFVTFFVAWWLDVETL